MKERPPFYACKVLSELGRQRVGSTLGRDVYALIALIVGMEDDLRYKGPIEIWNSTFTDALGFTPRALSAARRRAVEAGWLVYERRGTRSPGVYQTKFPDEIITCNSAPNQASITRKSAPNEPPIERKSAPNQAPIECKSAPNNASIMRKFAHPSSLEENPTTTPTEPDPFEAVVVELKSWGMTKAAEAVDAARRHGWTVDAIRRRWKQARELECADEHQPGKLYQWMTGDVRPPGSAPVPTTPDPEQIRESRILDAVKHARRLHVGEVIHRDSPQVAELLAMPASEWPAAPAPTPTRKRKPGNFQPAKPANDRRNELLDQIEAIA